MAARNKQRMKSQMPNYEDRLRGLKLNLMSGEGAVINGDLKIQVRWIKDRHVSICFSGDKTKWKIDRMLIKDIEGEEK